MVEIDLARMRQLATDVRQRADAIARKAPVAQDSRESARGLKQGVTGMEGSQIAISVEETLKTLDTVLKYHVGRLRAIADLTDAAATTFEGVDNTNARDIDKARPR
ncbi:type VII secretion target [Nocardia sp. NPDC051981]|uniref:type VII secretion target n=1 Tax=Nocardia sp. NPDC051981 TaxID=3155417 RepID=UPI0034332D8E